MRFWALIILFLFLGSPVSAGEIAGNIEIGEKFFDLTAPEEDSYLYWRGYLRYRRDLGVNRHYSVRYELQQRDYTLRERHTSLMHELRGNLTYELTDRYRFYIRLILRNRSYPEAPLSTYSAVIPELQLNYYPTSDTTLTGLFRHQRRYYPEDGDKDYRDQNLTFTARHSLTSSFNINGRYRMGWEFPLEGPQKALEFEHRLAVGFRYVLD